MSPSPPRSIRYRQVVSLSHPIHPHIPCWPGDPQVVVEPVASLQQDGYYLRRFSMGEHSGTHINAPNSFDSAALGITSYPPAAFVHPAIVVDLQPQVEQNADYQLTVADIAAWEAAHGVIPADALVLLFTGWQRRWSDPEAFFNWDDQGQAHFPGFGAAATEWLLAERAIAGVGIDTHGVDPGLDSTYATNRLVLANQGIVLECLTHLDQLPPGGTTLVIGALPLQGGSGSPVSVLAFIP